MPKSAPREKVRKPRCSRNGRTPDGKPQKLSMSSLLYAELRETERPASPVAKAVSYALNIENELRKFLNNPKLNIDNNPAEQLSRGVPF